jgi:hypothetical protein
MIERFIQSVQIEDPGAEAPAATRERLRALFPPGATRRMTQLGLLIGRVLDPLQPTEGDAIIYASSYGESLALEAYLASFPTPSPTLFQTSIHPAAVQQYLVARQQPVGEFLPFAGGAQIVGHAVQAALLSPAPRALLCGGEARATWLTERRAASPVTFAFALALTTAGGRGAGTLRLTESGAAEGELALPEFFAALRDRRPLDQSAAPGLQLTLAWN